MGRAPLQHPVSRIITALRFANRKRCIAVLAAALLAISLPAVAASAADGSFVGSASRPGNDGYWLVTPGGDVRAFGSAAWLGDMNRFALNRPIVGMASTPSGNGYWLVVSDGGIFSFGDARFFGSTGSIKLNQPIVGMSSTPSGNGYWLVATDGGIFAYGDASFFGSTGSLRLNKPIVGMAATPTGNGYWLVATDGGVFAYGDANFFGSTGGMRLNQPVVGIASTPSNRGYWMVGADGGIFAFGDAQFYGSAATAQSSARAIAIVRTSNGGYGIARADGAFEFYSAGSVASVPAPGSYNSTWTLLHQENFDGSVLNSARWSVYNGTGNEGVGFRRPSAIGVGNGELTITNTADIGGGLCWCGPATPAQTYGRWEIRAKTDVGTGYGPALLLWPDSERWPIDGEIDISEIPQGARTRTHFTVHYGANNSSVGHSDAGDFSQWHTYAVEWMPDHISYFLDGVLKYTVTNQAAIPRTSMHLAIQNDVGAAGHWIPGRDASTPASVALHVDYVKIYQ